MNYFGVLRLQSMQNVCVCMYYIIYIHYIYYVCVCCMYVYTHTYVFPSRRNVSVFANGVQGRFDRT